MATSKQLTLNALMKASAQKKVEEINAKTTNLLRGENSLLSKTVDTASSVLTSVKSLAKTCAYESARLELDSQREFMKEFGL